MILITKLQCKGERLKCASCAISHILSKEQLGIFDFIDVDHNGHLTRDEAEEFFDAAGSTMASYFSIGPTPS